jgi:hypothetical protein
LKNKKKAQGLALFYNERIYVSSNNEPFMIKIYMNLYKIIGIFIIGLCSGSLYSKSISISNSYYSKTQSIEFKNCDDKLKLNVSKDDLFISSLNVQVDNFIFKKGDVCNTKNLKDGFKVNVYLKYKFNNFELYSSIPSLDDNHCMLNGISWKKDNLELDISIFKNIDTTDRVYLKSYFDDPKLIKDLKMGYISIFDYESANIDVRYELVNTIMGTYSSSYLAIGFDEMKIFFEKQNLNYLYHLGLKIRTNEIQVIFDDYLYPQSKFSGKGASRKYDMDCTINRKIKRELIFGYSIKSLRFKLYEKVESDEDLKYKRTDYYYATLYLSKNEKYNVNVRYGIINEKSLIELTINNFKIGYSYKGFYDTIDLKFKHTNTSLNISYVFKKKLDIKLVYSF